MRKGLLLFLYRIVFFPIHFVLLKMDKKKIKEHFNKCEQFTKKAIRNTKEVPLMIVYSILIILACVAFFVALLLLDMNVISLCCISVFGLIGIVFNHH